MAEYYIEWSIEIDADSPREAAEKALAIQRDPNSSATVFKVWERAEMPDEPEIIDLDEPVIDEERSNGPKRR
jgi:hypothetical protein